MIERALVIANLDSSRASGGVLEAALEKHMGAIEHRVHWLGNSDDARQVASEALDEEWDVAVAAGGDGTVARVAEAASEAGVPLAIVPMGTANMLAEQLGIPGEVDGALGLITQETGFRRVDAMEISGRFYFVSAGVGVSATTVRDLSEEDKRRFGFYAYVWLGIGRGFTFRPTKCKIWIDGRRRKPRILDISVINAGFRSERLLPGMPDIRPDDGLLDVLTVWAPSPLEYLKHLERSLSGWRRVHPSIQWRTAEREVVIDCDEPLIVQADGDLIGETPVTIRLVPGAVGVLVPPESVPNEA